MNALFVAPLSALAGTFLGWFLNQISNWSKGRKEDNQIRKETLFNLLEVLHVFRRTNVLFSGEFYKLLQYLDSAIPGLNLKSASHEEVRQVIITLQPLMENTVLTDLEKLEKGYEDTIKKLSSVDPVIAYTLKGRTSVFQEVRQFVTEYNTKVIANNVAINEAGKVQQVFADLAHYSVYNQAIGIINAEALAIARKISWRMGRNIKKMLAPKPAIARKQEEEDFEEFAQLFAALLKNSQLL